MLVTQVRLPKPDPNGTIARILLAFLASAGLYYVNIMPALVDGLVVALDFSNRDAGLAASANVYGAAAGAFIAIFLIGRIPWRPVALALLIGLIAMDLFSMTVSSPEMMIATRFVHGCIGGLLIGVAFAIIARTSQPDRVFGFLFLVQYGLGGLGVMFLPPLVPDFGIMIVFLALITFSSVTLVMLWFLPEYPARKSVPHDDPDRAGGTRILPFVLILLAIFLYQAANMGLAAFIIGLGKNYGLDTEFVSRTLGAAAWLGLVGALLVITVATRFGRTVPLLLAIVVTIIGNYLLHQSDNKVIFIFANCSVAITWAFSMSYLLGMTASFDTTGRATTLAGFVSKMGLASGPMAAALLLGDDRYALLINIAVAALVICLVIAIKPVLLLDREKASG